MPDTTPERPVIGVRVHFNDTRPSVTHTTARKWYAETDGYLRVTDANAQDIAVHASIDWAWAELVFAEECATAEPEPPKPAPPIVDAPIQGMSVSWTPNADSFTTSKIERAKKELRDAQNRLGVAHDALGVAIQDAKDDDA